MQVRDGPPHSGRTWGLNPFDVRRYRLSDEWRAVRLAKYREVGRQCQDCQATRERLEVHHLTYEHFGHEPLADLRVLCQPCHAWRHGGPEPKKLRERRVQRETHVKKREVRTAQTELAEARRRCTRRRAKAAQWQATKKFWGLR